MGTTQQVVFDDAGTLQLVLSLFLPLLVGLVTKMSTNSGVRAVLLLALTAVGSVIKSAYDAAENHISWDWKTVVYGTVFTFVAAVAVHFGLWSPTGASTAAKQTLIVDAQPVAVQDEVVTPPPVEQATEQQQYLAEVYAGSAKPIVDNSFFPPPTGQPVAAPPPSYNDTAPIPDPVTIPEVEVAADEPTPIAEEAAAATKPTKRTYVRKAPVKKVAAKAPAKKVPAKKVTPVKRAR